jgi:hypothetical protein
MNRDQEWHPFNPDDHSTHPSDISSVQVMFDNGRQANGDWLYGRVFNVYEVPESTIIERAVLTPVGAKKLKK